MYGRKVQVFMPLLNRTTIRGAKRDQELIESGGQAIQASPLKWLKCDQEKWAFVLCSIMVIVYHV